MVDIHNLKLPEDIHKLSLNECQILCKQIREIILKTVSENGGHLASNLGTVELTVALHRVFHSPQDKIIWDVGHQSYTNKILTGRLDKFSTLRQKNGISGFPKPNESPHDIFISGHSSTSISVACGVADAMRLKGDNDHFTIAVIGDGALTGGLAYEGLNNAGNSKNNLIVILNDNEKSISKNVGALSKYLRSIRTKESYVLKKQQVEKALRNIPVFGDELTKAVKKVKDSVTEKFMNKKDMTLFENLGFVYLGPVDGHSVADIDDALRAARTYRCPVLVHINTIKGKGYKPAEENPGEYHSVGKFDLLQGVPTGRKKDTFSDVFGKHLTYLGQKDNRICAITAAMKYGTGLQYFCQKFPERFFDVGIAEEHAVTFSAGLASQKMIPVFAVYSSFLQRSYDQMLHDVAIGGQHVVLGIDRAGIVGADGETHQGLFDIGLLMNVPGSSIYSPYNYKELKYSLEKAIYKEKYLACVRYPKGVEDEYIDIPETKDYFLDDSDKSDTLIITYGRISGNVFRACDRIKKAPVINVNILKLLKIYPLPENIDDILIKYKKIYVFEETYKNSAIGALIAEKTASYGKNIKVSLVSCDSFIKQNDVSDSIDEVGLSEDKIYSTLIKFEK